MFAAELSGNSEISLDEVYYYVSMKIAWCLILITVACCGSFLRFIFFFESDVYLDERKQTLFNLTWSYITLRGVMLVLKMAQRHVGTLLICVYSCRLGKWVSIKKARFTSQLKRIVTCTVLRDWRDRCTLGFFFKSHEFAIDYLWVNIARGRFFMP